MFQVPRKIKKNLQNLKHYATITLKSTFRFESHI